MGAVGFNKEDDELMVCGMVVGAKPPFDGGDLREVSRFHLGGMALNRGWVRIMCDGVYVFYIIKQFIWTIGLYY